MKNGYFKSFDGTKIYFQEEGEGIPILFLYGLVCSDRHWKYQIDYFKLHYRVIWADYRGHHNSETPSVPENITIEAIGKDVVQLLDHLGIDKVVLFGHSVGVTVALELYHRISDRIQLMALCNGTSRLPLESLLLTNIPQIVHPVLMKMYKRIPKIMNLLWASQANNKLVHWSIGKLGFNPNLAKSEDIIEYVRNFSKLDLIVFLQLLKSYEEYDATTWLNKIKCPVLIIAGENDMVIPREKQELMSKLIPHSKFELIKKGSHCPQMDIPALINTILEEFLKANLN